MSLKLAWSTQGNLVSRKKKKDRCITPLSRLALSQVYYSVVQASFASGVLLCRPG